MGLCCTFRTSFQVNHSTISIDHLSKQPRLNQHSVTGFNCRSQVTDSHSRNIPGINLHTFPSFRPSLRADLMVRQSQLQNKPEPKTVHPDDYFTPYDPSTYFFHKYGSSFNQLQTPVTQTYVPAKREVHLTDAGVSFNETLVKVRNLPCFVDQWCQVLHLLSISSGYVPNRSKDIGSGSLDFLGWSCKRSLQFQGGQSLPVQVFQRGHQPCHDLHATGNAP